MRKREETKAAMEFFATCPTGFERILANELGGLGLSRVRPLQGQVAFEGELSAAYRACLWSRIASRVIAVLGRVDAGSADQLYEGMSELLWEEHLAQGTTFAIRATGSNAELRNTQFVALRAKDAVVDRMSAKTGARPNVDAKNPDLGIVVRVSRNRATVGIDLAGAPLFQRGYERRGDGRGLRSDYASALLALNGWSLLPSTEKDQRRAILDASPHLGSILVEAALMDACHAPGLLRLNWGFDHWKCHDKGTWEQVVSEAREQAQGSPTCRLAALRERGGVSSVRSALRAAGLEAELELVRPERLSDELGLTGLGALVFDLSHLGAQDLVQEAAGLLSLYDLVRSLSPASIAIAGRSDLSSAYLQEAPLQRIETILGREPVLLSAYGTPKGQGALPEVTLGQDSRVSVLVGTSDQFAARLRKVVRLRGRWARREDVSCYRVYDTDLPDYAVAIDLFQGCDPQTGGLDGRRWLAISEYAPPKDIDEDLARRRLVDVLAIAPRVLDVRPQDTFLRVRTRAKGGSAYADEARGALATRTPDMRGKRGTVREVTLPAGAHLVDEGGLTFEVNFLARHDCGIFLDHRDTRTMLREMAKQTKGSKRFLNLFAYTGTATCYAADGGMLHTTTVDLSRPSLDWARRNMARNGFTGREHEFVQADVTRWVQEQRHTRNRWDLVFCDVPTFSNSSRMGRRSFDVQHDHAELLIGISRLLTRNGTCVFSCNLRSFKPDTEKLARAGVSIEDVTERTIPEDFARNKRVHHTYLVRRDVADHASPARSRRS